MLSLSPFVLDTFAKSASNGQQEDNSRCPGHAEPAPGLRAGGHHQTGQCGRSQGRQRVANGHGGSHPRQVEVNPHVRTAAGEKFA